MAKALSFSELDPDVYQPLLERAVRHPLARLTTPDRVERMVRVAVQRLHSVTVVFENLWDSHNRAAVLRTAEGLGVSRAHVVEDGEHYRRHRGITHGAERWLELHRYATVVDVVNQLQSEGFMVCAADVGEDCVSLEQIPGDRPLAVLLGSEKSGLSEQAKHLADLRFTIPMAGFTGSFNVSVSGAIALWEICRKRRDALGRHGDLDVDEAYELVAEWLERNTSAGKRVRNLPAAKRPREAEE